MPRFGSCDVTRRAPLAGEIRNYKTDALVLKGAQILNLAIEIDDVKADKLLPPALHPSIPQYALFNIMHCPDSPWGKFSIAEVRVACRAGVRPRGFVMRSFVDNPAARADLAARWGFPVAEGSVLLDLRHDRVRAEVRAAGKLALECEMLDREVISGADIQYVANMNLARNREDGKLVLVQVDPEFVFAKAERGKPRVSAIDDEAWMLEGNLALANPIAGSFSVADVTLPRLRYVCDPGKPAFQGTTKVAA